MHLKNLRFWKISALFIVTILFLGSSGNPPNGRTNAPGDGYCEDCHTPGNPLGLDGAVIIENFPSTIIPNTDYTITVRVTNPNGLAARAGFQAVVLDENDSNIGDLSLITGTNPTTTTSGGREYIEHNPAINFDSNNEVVWDFIWTAPSGGDGEIIKMYAAGNIASGSNGNSNDLIQSSIAQGTVMTSATLTVEITNSTNVSCFGENNGTATAQAMDGTPPYSFSWSNGESSATVVNLSAGTHTVTATDANGATATETVTITEPSQIIANVTSTTITCTTTTSTATANATGGIAPYNYAWSTGGIGPQEGNLAPGTYSVTITDNNGCTNIQSFSPTLDISPPFVDAGPNQIIGCGTSVINLDGTASESGPFITYLWTTFDGNIISGANTPIATVDQSGNYTLTVFNSENGCEASSSIFVDQINPPFLQIEPEDVYCNGGSSGIIDLTVIGGEPPFDFSWDDAPNSTTEDLLEVVAGFYCVTVTDGNSCVSTICETINEPAAITATASITNLTCALLCDGAIDLTVQGGTGVYSFEWSNGETTEDINDLCDNMYSVTITDANNCTTVESFSIIGPDALSIATDIENVSCNGSCDGSVDITVTGGTPPYSYNWNNGISNVEDPDNLCAGGNGVTVTDANGCSASIYVEIEEPSPVTADLTCIDESSPGANDGTCTVESGGGSPPYTETWSVLGSGITITDLAPGNYCVTITDGNGCTATNCAEVNPGTCVSIEGVVTNVSCNGGCDGSIDLSVSDGPSPYIFEWSDPTLADTEDQSNLCADTYTVTVTDADNCSTVASFTVQQPLFPLMANFSPDDVDCFGDCSGSIQLSVTGGTSPYSFNWNNGSTACDLSDICAGTYMVTITDANDCSFTGTVLVDQPDELSIVGIVSDAACNGDCNGAISTNVAGGILPYTYLWDNGDTNPNLDNICAGQYTVTVTDANNCTIESTFTISDPAIINPPNISGVLTFCNGENSILDAGAGYESYLWSTGEETQTITVNTSGVYSVIVTNSIDNCPASTSVTVIESNELNISVSTIAESTTGANDGSATANNASQELLTYLWNDPNGQTTQTALNLAPGQYCVTVTDISGCTAESCGTVDATTSCALEGSISTFDVSCFGGNDGTANATISGGVEPYSYLWSNEDESVNAINLAVGVYMLTVTDADDCTLVLTTTITEPEQMMVSSTQTNPSCFGSCDGTVSLTVTGGTAPYSYQWSGPCTGQNPVNICPGTFTVVVTDANGCTFEHTVVLSQPPLIELIVTCTNESAPGANDGVCQVDIAGGIAGYTELWSNGFIGTTITGLAPGEYCVTVTDSNNCTAVSCGMVFEAGGCNLTLEAQSSLACFESCDGVIDLTINNGTAPYIYQWSDPTIGNIEDPVNLCPGDYSVTVTDGNDCIDSISINILENDEITGILTFTLPTSCVGDCNGFIETNIQGGTAGYTYLWNNGATTATNEDLCDGIDYSLTVTDATGCTAVFIPTVFITPSPPLIETTLTTINCFGDCDGGITVNVIDGQEPFDYDWENDIYDGLNVLTNLCEDDYIVTITDGNGCAIVALIPLDQPDELLLNIATTDACFDECDGTTDITVTGGIAPYTYQWSEDPQDLCPGEYHITVTDENNCSVVGSFSIGENPELTYSIDQTINEMNTEGNGAIDITVNGGSPSYSYAWSDGTSTVSTVEDPMDLPAGTYTCEITDANGCVITTEEITLDNIVNTFQIAWKDQINIFPNPVNDVLLIEYNLNESLDLTLEIFDVRGVKILEQATISNNNENCKLDLSRLTNGVYALRISSKESFYTYKIIKADF